MAARHVSRTGKLSGKYYRIRYLCSDRFRLCSKSDA